MANIKIILLFIIFSTLSAQESWQSSIVYYEQDKLVYVSDDEGNRIPDFSYAGYKNSNEEIPFIEVVKEISPIQGDNTSHIQQAINEVGSLPINENGFRGALLLNAGEYEVYGTIKINFDGIILRGAGDENDSQSNTIIKGMGDSPHQRTIMIAGGGNSSAWSTMVWGTQTNITSYIVYVGENKFEVENTSSFSVGDNIIIYHPCSEKWLEAINYGGTHSDDSNAEAGIDIPWTVNSQPILFNRYITAIEGNKIIIDVPVFNHLIKDLSQSYIYKLNKQSIRKHIGIEKIRIDIADKGETNENHAWTALDLFEIEDAWVKDCTFLHFGLSGIQTNTASRITIKNCKALDPKSIIEGGKRYNFNIYTASQQILFEECFARNGRHHYISNGTTWTSGCVFHNCTSSGAYASSEGHRRWTMGILFDNHKELDGPRPGEFPRLLGLYNRGCYGTSHGWGLANSVAWNCDVAGGTLICQKPPLAQNYAIGCFGDKITGERPYASFEEPNGFIEGSNRFGLTPASLFEAQLNERKNVLSLGQDQQELPEEITLHQNYPNPFNPTTKIGFELNKSDHVKIKVYDALGRLVYSIEEGNLSAGYHTITFNASSLSTGIYFYSLITTEKTVSKKMLLLK